MNETLDAIPAVPAGNCGCHIYYIPIVCAAGALAVSELLPFTSGRANGFLHFIQDVLERGAALNPNAGLANNRNP